LLNVFVLKRSEFCLAGKTRVRLSKNDAQLATRRDPATTMPIVWIGKSSTRTSEVGARENFCPLDFTSTGIVSIPHERTSSTEFLKFSVKISPQF